MLLMGILLSERSLPMCRELGIQRVLVTCDEENEASRRTILKNVGVYASTAFEPDEGKNVQRYWIDLAHGPVPV